ncbi:MAG: Mut7-C RNAse domain-containing protein [Candidatus Auribacterota bacterium]|nr:Mut7-C RNAse domain-containing protein [Candidatus Auribacterota bacterium]
MNSRTQSAEFRFYAELNDFLGPDRRQKIFAYTFNGSPSIKDAIEAIGVPHTAVDIILVNGDSVGFDHRLRPGERVSVYPIFESFDITPLIRLRAKPLRDPIFILDVHLGKLARIMRMLGFDSLYRNDYDDPEIIRIALRERRIILTRDRGILKNSMVTHGYWVRSDDAEEQAREVLARFDLFRLIKPFSRCISCNGLLEDVPKEKILDRLPPKTKMAFDKFRICTGCGKIYWPGSHYQAMSEVVTRLTEGSDYLEF